MPLFCFPDATNSITCVVVFKKKEKQFTFVFVLYNICEMTLCIVDSKCLARTHTTNIIIPPEGVSGGR